VAEKLSSSAERKLEPSEPREMSGRVVDCGIAVEPLEAMDELRTPSKPLDGGMVRECCSALLRGRV
jgi:hypothetical protein